MIFHSDILCVHARPRLVDLLQRNRAYTSEGNVIHVTTSMDAGSNNDACSLTSRQLPTNVFFPFNNGYYL